MKEYLYYLFDFDLTLADSSRGIVMCFTNVLHRHGFMDVTEMQIKRTIGKTLEESFSILTGETNPEQLAAWKLEYTKEADLYMNDNTVLFPETVEVLTKLKEEGAKLAIISTKYRYRIQAVIDKHFPQGFIDVIIGGEDVKQAKPHPQGVKTALRKLHGKKQYALYVGDSTVDAETAQNAGVDFCGVLNGMTTREELAVYPHRQILDNLTLLPLILKDYKNKKNNSQFSIFSFGTILSRLGIVQASLTLRSLLQKVNFQFKNRHRAAIIHQIRGNQDKPTEKLEQHVCQNCGDTFEGDYCRSCGQKASTERITVKGAIKNFFSSFFSIEGGFLRTCYELFWRPGYMVADFVKGKRIGYYKPFSLLIVMAAIYLVAGQLFAPKSSEEAISMKEMIESRMDSLMNNKFTSPRDTIAVTPNVDLEADNETETEEENDNEPNEVNSAVDVHLREWFDEHLGEDTFLGSLYNLLKDWFADNQAFLFVITIPFYLFGIRLSFKHTRMNQQLNIGEYVFIFGFFGSQVIMKDTLLIPIIGTEDHLASTIAHPILLSFLLEVFLMIRNFKQLFRVTWKTAIKGTIKTYLYLVLGIVLLVVAVIVIIATLTALGVVMFG